MRKEQNSHKLQIRVNVALLKTALAIKVKQAHLPLCLFLHTSLGLQGNHYCDRSFILIQCTCQIILYTISISLENVHLELHQYRREASLGARHAKGFWSHIQHCKYRVMPSKPVGLLWIHTNEYDWQEKEQKIAAQSDKSLTRRLEREIQVSVRLSY